LEKKFFVVLKKGETVFITSRRKMKEKDEQRSKEH
jgi:hypothetical protein